jgi:hypothetical protein
MQQQSRCLRRSGKMQEGRSLVYRSFVYHNRWCISEFHPPPWRLVFFFGGFKKNSPGFGPHLGFWYCVFLTLQKTWMICWKLLDNCVTYTWNCEKNSKIICVFGNLPWHITRRFLGCVCETPPLCVLSEYYPLKKLRKSIMGYYLGREMIIGGYQNFQGQKSDYLITYV